MNLSFVETMRGTITDGRGMEHPISFEVTALNNSGGSFELRGLISAPPFVDEAVAEGSVRIAPLLRAITYRLRFRGRDGELLTLDAEKHPSPLSPLRSMTEMEAFIRSGDGVILGRGRMRFDVRELPAFIASWLPGRRGQRERLDVRRRAVARRLLDGGLDVGLGGG